MRSDWYESFNMNFFILRPQNNDRCATDFSGAKHSESPLMLSKNIALSINQMICVFELLLLPPVQLLNLKVIVLHKGAHDDMTRQY